MPAGKRILVADDDALVRRLIADALRDAGYHVSEASDGLEVLRRLQAEPPDFLVLDLVMPEIDGAQVCRYLKAHPQLRALPVVLLSGAATESAARAEDLGVAAYLPKRAAEAMIPDLLRMLRALERGESMGEGGPEPHPRRIVGELLAAQARLQGILRNLGEGVLLLDADGHILFANSAACALLRREEHFLLGAKLTAVWPEAGEAIAHLLKEMKDRGAMSPTRMDLSCHGRPCALSFANITEDGRVVGHHLLVRDTTEAVRIEELAALNEMASLFASSLQLDEVLRRVVERSQALLRAEAASLLLADPRGGGLVFRVASGEYGGALPGVILPLGQGVAGWVYREGAPANVPDVSQDPRFYPGIDAKTGFRTRSILCVPLIVQGRAIGVLEVLNSRTASGFIQTQETLLVAIAGHAANAIENARLYEATQRELTERKRAGEALRRSEERYRDLVDNLNDVIFSVGTDGTITYVSPAVQAILGYVPPDIVGTPFTDIIHPEDRDRIRRAFGDILQGQLYASEYRIFAKSGEARWVRTSSRPIRVGEKVIGLQGVLIDITERKRAEEALRTSEGLLREAQHVARIGHWELDRVAGTPRWSEEIFHIFGLDPLQGEPSFEGHQRIIHPDDWHLLHGAVTRVLAEGLAFDIEFRLLRPDKNIRWMNAKGQATQDADGHIFGVFGTAQDITEHKLAEEALQVSLTKYQILFESLPLGVTISDKAGNILECNEEAERLLGLARDEHAKRKIDGQEWRIIRRDGSPMPADEYASVRALKGNRLIADVEMGIVKGEGDVGDVTWISVTAVPIPLEDYGVVIVYGDITERKRTEEVLRESRAELKAIYDHAPVMMCVVDADRRVLYANRAFAEFTGVAENDLQAGHACGVFGCVNALTDPRGCGFGHKCEDCSLRLAIEETFKTGCGRRDIERRLTLEHDGVRRDVVLLGATALIQASGQSRLLLCLQDITGRVRAEEALRASEERYRHVSSIASDVVYSCSSTDDGNYAVDWLIGAVEALTGYSMEALKARGCWTYLVIEEDQTLAERHVIGLVPGSSSSCELRIRRKNGTIRWLASSAECVLESVSPRIVRLYGVLVDITERKRAEEALAARTNQLDAVRSVSTEIAQELDLNTVLQLIVRRAVELVGATGGVVRLWDEASGLLIPRSWVEMGEGIETRTFRLGEGVTGTAAEGRTGMIVNDFRTSPYATPLFLAHTTHTSVMAEPLMCHDRLVGTISLVRAADRGPFLEEDRQNLVLLASPASIAIENARLYEQLLKDLVERRQAEETIRRYAERLLLEADVDRAILAADSPASIAQAAVERIRHLVPCQRAAMAVYEREAGRLVNVAVDADGATRVPVGTAVPVEDFDPEGSVLSGAVRHIHDLQAEETLPSILRMLAEDGIRSHITFPMAVEGRVLGVFSLCRNEVAAFTAEEQEILVEVGNRLAIVLERAQLFSAVLAQREELRALGRRLTETEESERRRISHELHDRVGQELTGLSLNLSILQEQLAPAADTKVGNRIRDCQALVDSTIGQIRNVMADLRPPVLDDYGLMATLRWSGELFGARAGLEMVVQGEEVQPRLPLAIETALYRIAQEALTNVMKYAQASRVVLTLEENGGRVLLTISDDGQGMEGIPVATTDQAGGWGIATMRERAEAVGGRFAIWSKPGEGTRVSVEIRRQG